MFDMLLFCGIAVWKTLQSMGPQVTTLTFKKALLQCSECWKFSLCHISVSYSLAKGKMSLRNVTTQKAIWAYGSKKHWILMFCSFLDSWSTKKVEINADNIKKATNAFNTKNALTRNYYGDWNWHTNKKIVAISILTEIPWLSNINSLKFDVRNVWFWCTGRGLPS